MGTKVYLYSGLKEFADGVDVSEVHGSTIGECLADLVRQFPRMKPVLFYKAGNLSAAVLVSINLKSMYPEQLAYPVGDSDDIYIVRVIAGG